jgi:hypothetical protein
MSAVYCVDVGCRPLLLFPIFPLLLLLSVMLMGLVRCLLSELDAAGQADALELLLLRSSDAISADVKLDKRPVVLWIAVNNSSSKWPDRWT